MRLDERVKQALNEFRGRWPVLRNSLRVRERREPAMKELPPQALSEVRRIREDSVRNLEKNLEKLRRAAEEVGAELYVAGDAEEAKRIVLEICMRLGARLVVKTKSLTTEEIGLNRVLEEAGIEVVETDLGERIVQLAGQRPSHILGPAFHMTRHDIARLFSEHFGETLPPEPERLVKEVRRELREKFLSADLAITGANLIVAEDGVVALITNEGNDRLALAFAPAHIIVAGVEKLVSSLHDALKIIKVLPRSATGQRLSAYVSLQSFHTLSYPRNSESGVRRVFIVLVDNGRMRARLDDELIEALYCIRCAACLSVCPTYNMVGGHVFGHIYSGPMGIPWTLITSGLKETEFAQLCYTCGLCKEACPVDIDLPFINSVVKHKRGEVYGHPRINRMIAHYEGAAKLASFTAPLANKLLSTRGFRKLIEMLMGVDARRPLPKFRKRHLGKLFRELGSGEKGKVAFFTDSLIYYSYPEIGLSSARLLADLGYRVILPPQRSSGMPLIQYGFLDQARKVAEYNVKVFHRLVKEGYEVVAVEPTAHYCLREVYPKLLRMGEAWEVAENSHSFFEFLRASGWSNVEKLFKRLDGLHVLYHLPCHSRARDGSIPVKELLEYMGARVSFKPLGCCGMAGTWGMKKRGHGYELSVEIGKFMAGEYEETGAELIVTESTVCALQFNHLSHLPVRHPLELLKPDKGERGKFEEGA